MSYVQVDLKSLKLICFCKLEKESMRCTRKQIFLTCFTRFPREQGAVLSSSTYSFTFLSPSSSVLAFRMSFLCKTQNIWGKLLMKQIEGERERGGAGGERTAEQGSDS